MKILIRKMVPSDKDFVVKTWLDYYKKHSAFGKSLASSVFYREHNKKINDWVETPKANVYVAADEEEPNLIFGFIAFEKVPVDMLHFVFTRKELRNQGIASSLFKLMSKSNELVITHQGELYALKNRYKAVHYNPYIFLETK